MRQREGRKPCFPANDPALIAWGKLIWGIKGAQMHLDLLTALGKYRLDLHRFCSGQVLMLSGPLLEGHG